MTRAYRKPQVKELAWRVRKKIRAAVPSQPDSSLQESHTQVIQRLSIGAGLAASLPNS
jgi:hypothetical protein